MADIMKNRSQVSDITIDFQNKGDKPAMPPEAEREFVKFYRQQPAADLSRLVKQARHKRTWMFAAITFAILTALAAAGYFMLNGSAGKFGEEKVLVEMQGPPSAPSGQAVEYRLTFTNDQTVALGQVEVNLRYPEGFAFERAEPAPNNSEGTRFSLPDIAGHGVGILNIRGSLVGEVGDHKELMAVLTYEPESFKAQFAKTVSVVTEIVASVLTLNVTAPPQLPIDQPLSLLVSYRNSSANKLGGLVLRLTAPSGFELEVPTLEVFGKSGSAWKLADLEPRAEGKAELKGRFTDAALAGAQELRLAVGFGVGEDFAVQEEKVVNINLVKSHLTLQLTANDVSLKSAVELGQEVAYELSFVNEGDLPFTDVTLAAQLDTKFLDFSSLRDDAFGSADGTSGVITWTKDNLPLLASLLPGTRGSIRFRLNTVPTVPLGTAAPLQFNAKVTARGSQLIEGTVQPVTAESNVVLTKINTQFLLGVEGRYFTDELVKLGSGPLPPKVGETTTYVIFWQLGNTLNEADNIEVTTTLPQDVTWTGQSTVTAGQRLTYNPNTREVRWQLNRLPAGAGTTFPKPEATFEVAVTPQGSDADKILVLTKTTTGTARDSFSEADIIATGKFVTTELDDDLAAQGKGIVVR